MKINKTVNTAIKVSLLWFISMASYADVALRVVCLDSDTDVTIYINDQKKGSCPNDFVVVAGDIRLRAVKVVDADHEQVFEENFYMADEDVKKIRVRLSETRLNAAAVKRELLARLQQEKEFAESELAKAQNGDIEAMSVLAGLYQSGKGVTKSLEMSDGWKNKAIETQQYNDALLVLNKADGGDLDAIDVLVDIYESGNGFKIDKVKASAWRDKKLAILQERDEAYAQEKLKKAQAGYAYAMKEIADLYRTGKGIEKNASKSQEWDNKYTQAIDEQENSKARAAALQRKKDKLEKIDYLSGPKFGWEAIVGVNEESGPILATSLLPVGLLSSIGGLISAPYQTTKKMMLQNEIDAHVAQWGAPDSMVAKAKQ